MPRTREPLLPRLLAVALSAPLAACAAVGPSTIYQGRGLYNQVIAETSAQQTLLNIVRAHFGEEPLFLEVDGIAAAATSQLSLGGTESQLGLLTNPSMVTGARLMSGAVGQIMSGGQINEQPTVTMKPVAGAALISQVASPITADSIVSLYDSGGYIGSIFDLAVFRFTPAFDDYHAALNALMALDRYGSLILEARGPTELVIYYQRNRPRARFTECDAVATRASGTAVADNLWARLQDIFGQSGDAIVLEISSLPASAGAKAAGAKEVGSRTRRSVSRLPPLLRTRSALGMLNSVTVDDNLVVFQRKEVIDDIIQGNASDQRSKCRVSFYNTVRSPVPQRDPSLKYDNERFVVDNGETHKVLDPEGIQAERKAADERRLILVETSTLPPTDAYVSVPHDGLWYSIRRDDLISKRNFALIAQIDTIQASPTAPASLVPTINVGARP